MRVRNTLSDKVADSTSLSTFKFNLPENFVDVLF